MSFLEFLGSNLDTLAIGHYIGASQLGLYNRGSLLVNLPLQNITSSFSRVLLPSFSRIQKDAVLLKRSYLFSLFLFASVLFPASAFALGASNELVAVVLGRAWMSIVPVVAILALSALFGLLAHVAAVICEATGKLLVKIAIQLGFLSFLATMVFAFLSFGIIGIAVSVTMATTLLFVAYTIVMVRSYLISKRELWEVYRQPLLVGLLVALGAVGVAYSLQRLDPAPVVVLLAQALSACGVVVAVKRFSPERAFALETEERLTALGYESDDASPLPALIRWFVGQPLAGNNQADAA